MDIKAYKKQFTYSYSLGAFPTIELLKTNNVILDATNITIKSRRKLLNELKSKASGNNT